MGSKKRNEILKELSKASNIYISNKLSGLLEKKIAAARPNGKWILTKDPDNTDQQTLIFHYPQSVKDGSQYVRPIVKIELGARSDHWPAHQQKINSYLKEALGNMIEENSISIKVLNVERTFWEKATILHMYAHFPEGKDVPERQSRHYYDFYCLLKSRFKISSAKEIKLLERVSVHKSIYFRAAWASYNTACKGTLKLIPPAHVIEQMEKDYALMNEMFFITPPKWVEIINAIQKFEKKFNRI